MNVIDNRINRNENSKYQTTNTIYDQNLMAIINKIIKSNSHQIKTKQSNLIFDLYLIWNDMRPVLNATGWKVDKKSKEVRKSKTRFRFWKQLILPLFTSLDINWIPKMFIYIPIASNWDMSLSKFHLHKLQSQWNLRSLLYIKKETKVL